MARIDCDKFVANDEVATSAVSCGTRRRFSEQGWKSLAGPLDFVGDLAAMVPKPRVTLTRFHGVFAPDNKHGCLRGDQSFTIFNCIIYML